HPARHAEPRAAPSQLSTLRSDRRADRRIRARPDPASIGSSLASSGAASATAATSWHGAAEPSGSRAWLAVTIYQEMIIWQNIYPKMIVTGYDLLINDH
ncbi:MAG TPA: hypothetical protein VK698_07475, partial [Kofleriaceae bacterium]|nr:hypothetical protein [Kofleriaceae bacterium]